MAIGWTRRRRIAAVVALLTAVVAFAATTVRLFIRPDLAPLPPHADAIIDLGGVEAQRLDREVGNKPEQECANRSPLIDVGKLFCGLREQAR